MERCTPCCICKLFPGSTREAVCHHRARDSSSGLGSESLSCLHLRPWCSCFHGSFSSGSCPGYTKSQVANMPVGGARFLVVVLEYPDHIPSWLWEHQYRCPLTMPSRRERALMPLFQTPTWLRNRLAVTYQNYFRDCQCVTLLLTTLLSSRTMRSWRWDDFCVRDSYLVILSIPRGLLAQAQTFALLDNVVYFIDSKRSNQRCCVIHAQLMEENHSGHLGSGLLIGEQRQNIHGYPVAPDDIGVQLESSALSAPCTIGEPSVRGA